MKAIVSEAEFGALGEAMQAEYTKQEDGRFLLKVDAVDGFSLENVEGLKNTVATLRQEVGDGKTKLKSFEGLDAAKAREAIAKLEEMKDWTPEQKVKEQIDAAVKEIKSKAETDLAGANETAQTLRAQLQKVLVDNAARTALGKMKLIDGVDVDLLMPHIHQAVAVKEVDGQQVVRVRGEAGGDRVTMKQGSTEPMGLEEFVGLLPTMPQFKGLFASSGKTGTGTTPNGNGQHTNVPVGSTSGSGEQTYQDPVNRLADARRAQNG